MHFSPVSLRSSICGSHKLCERAREKLSKVESELERLREVERQKSKSSLRMAYCVLLSSVLSVLSALFFLFFALPIQSVPNSAELRRIRNPSRVLYTTNRTYIERVGIERERWQMQQGTSCEHYVRLLQ